MEVGLNPQNVAFANIYQCRLTLTTVTINFDSSCRAQISIRIFNKVNFKWNSSMEPFTIITGSIF